PGDVQLYVEIHNMERSEHGALDLVWNDTLANVAQSWADKCTNQHSGGTLGPFGENLAAGTGQFNTSDVLGLWNKEEPQYNAADPQASHWTQVVWKGTSDLG
ncbi:CAP domain-containing protein, partial [Mycena sp. CBHHK59/15]